MNKTKILVVEDELEIGRLLEIMLVKDGHLTTWLKEGLSALQLLEKEKFDLVLLDWMLPIMPGIELIRHLRQKENQTPVIFITAKTQPQDIVAGLEAGADDYLTKPFDHMVLRARIDSVLRRYRLTTPTPFSELKFQSLSMNMNSYEVFLEEKPLHLTKSEFVILSELIKNEEKVLTRHQLVEKTQGDGVNVTSRTIDTHVFGLRKKLSPHSDWIETIRGVGYRLTHG